MITETTIAGISSFDATKAPEFYRSRKASQYAKNIEEWVQIFSAENNGGYANSWLLGDIKTGEIARFEMGLKFSGLEKTKNGYYGGFNTPANLKIRNQECDGEGEEYSDIRKNGSRRLRWMQLMNERQGSIDVENAKAMIGDHYDVYLKQENNPCSRTICGHLELDKAEYGRRNAPRSWDREPQPSRHRGRCEGRIFPGSIGCDRTPCYRKMSDRFRS